jgi:hypothetical protein
LNSLFYISRCFVTLVCLLASLGLIGQVSAEESKLHVSGFARVVLGYLEEPNVEYMGYENSLKANQQSLLGIQADYKISDKFSVTGQLIQRAGGLRDSGVEWLYLTYTPTRSLKFKLGRQRTPVFNYSDFVDVGFAYPWVSLPQLAYRPFLFPSFDGLHVNYEWSRKAYTFNLEGYWGQFDMTSDFEGQRFTTQLSDLHGTVATVAFGNLTLRGSYHTGQAETEQQTLFEFGQQLSQLGFNESAQSIATKGGGGLYQASIHYENLDYFLLAEFSKLDSDIFITPNTSTRFVSAGYNFFPFVGYVSYAKNINRYAPAETEIPQGVNPQLDALALAYQQVFQTLVDDSSTSLTLGVRWDVLSNLALKVETSVIRADAGSRGFLLSQPNGASDGKGHLHRAAIEWVF